MTTHATASATVTAPAVEQSRLVVTEVPGPNSLAWEARRQAVVARGVSSAVPVFVERAHGGIVEDVDGNRFIDLTSGIGVTTVGHTDQAVIQAAGDQLERFVHTMFPVAPYDSYVRVAELLAEFTPGQHDKRSVIVSTGAEAVENAVKIARHYTGRTGVAVLDHAYHGRTNLTMAMTYKAMPYKSGFGPFAPDVVRAPGSYPYRDGLTGAEAAARTIEVLEKSAGAANIAVLVVEPIQGEGGFIVPADGYLPAIADWCAANGIVFVADEIQSGIARTGRYYASEHFGVIPDLVLTAKGVAGGLPLAAVTGRAEIMDSSHAGGLGGTFGGNPVACAAALAVFDQIQRVGLLARAEQVEALLKPALEDLARRYPVIGDVRGIGAMLAIELVQPGTTTPNAEAVAAITRFTAEHGVLTLSAGTFGNVLRFLPNLATSDELLLDALSVLDDAFAAVS